MNLNQITIPSLNLEKSIPFYQTLGLKIIVKAFRHYARFECPDGNSTFSIQQVEQLPTGSGVHIYFDEMPNDKKWLWREAHLKGIDGNHLIL